MTALIISLVIVGIVLLSALMQLLKKTPLPPQDVLDRVKERERQLQAQEKAEEEGRGP